MKNYPQNIDQWSQEAYQSMISAWDLLTKGNPFPTENQKEKLIEKAVSMACENRDISDATFITHAQDYANAEFLADYNSRELTTKVNFSLCFLLAYFDAHLALSMITKEDAKGAMVKLKNNFDLSYIGKAQTNAFTVSYTGKI